MNKKIILLYLLLFSMKVIANEYINVEKDAYLQSLVIPESVLLYDNSISREENFSKALEINRFMLEIWRQTNLDFLQKSVFNTALIKNQDEKSIENVKKNLKEGKEIFELYGNSNSLIFTWCEGEKYSFSTQYSQVLSTPIINAGVYVIRLFLDSYVYTFRLSDYVTIDEQNDDFDSLTKYMYYKKGQKMDKNRGLEQTQGYYWKTKNSYFQFYEDLQLTPQNFPSEYIKNFYITRIEIEDSLRKIIGTKKSKQKSTTNLRIRESAINGKAIVTIQEGVEVFVITDGVKDTIDGIKGKWVKVVVPKGSKDKDGKIIEKDFLGWCFDGYLD